MVKVKKDDTTSTHRILKAAEEIFAEKGFDGARVDEIARRAGVNKALIYYYFESKEKILEELSKKHLQEMLDSKEKMLKEMQIIDGNLPREVVGNMIETSLWSMLGDHKDFMGIILIESLKNQSSGTAFFRLANQVYDDSLNRFKKMGYEIDTDKFKTFAFFFGVLPVIFYITMGEKWTQYSGVSPEKAKAAFIEGLTDMDFSLFLNKFNLAVNKEMVDTLYQDKFNLYPEENSADPEGKESSKNQPPKERCK